MAKYHTEPLDKTFAALADHTRRALLARIAQGEVSMMVLAAPTGLALPTITKHLRVLEQAGLVLGVKRGRTRWYHLRPQPLSAATEWLETYRTFWDAQLDALTHFVEETSDEP